MREVNDFWTHLHNASPEGSAEGISGFVHFFVHRRGVRTLSFDTGHGVGGHTHTHLCVRVWRLSRSGAGHWT